MLTAPDSAMTVVVHHHPIEASLQASRLRRVFHLLCVQHLHKSKLISAVVASTCSSAPQWENAQEFCARLFELISGIATLPHFQFDQPRPFILGPRESQEYSNTWK
jgi:hypothetical protein